METLWQLLRSMHWVEWASVLSAAAYVILAARQHIACWIFGIVSAILWAYAALHFYKLYSDALLQVYYVGMGIYGWWMWQRDRQSGHTLNIQLMTARQHGQLLLVGTIFSLGLGYFFEHYTDAAASYWDAFTTVFSILTTFLVARRYLDNWLYWVVIDAVYVYLYASRGGHLFAVLNAVYVVVAIVGYLNWRRSLTSPA